MTTQTENPIYTTPETTPAPEQPDPTPKAPWRAPTLTRIDLKRTMFGSAVAGDFASASGV